MLLNALRSTILRKMKILEKLAAVEGFFLTFLKFSLKFKEHIPFRETALNTLREI